MGVGIVAMAVARPGGTRSGRRAVGPDEDAFTLAADALEAVDLPAEPGGDSRPVGRVWLLGDLEDDAGWMVPELLGAPRAAVVRKESDRESFWTTVQTIAGRQSNDEDEVVVVSSEFHPEPSPEPSAYALRFRSDGGLRVATVGSVVPPGTHAVDVATAVRIELKNALPRGRATPPVVVLDRGPAKGAARPPGGAAIGGLAEWVGRQSPGISAVLIDADDRGPAFYSEVRLDSPVGVSGPWKDEGATAPDRKEPPRPTDESLPSRVSEGAYIPWPTYRQSLPSRWRFEADRCPKCQHLTFPSRGRCAACGTLEGLASVPLPRQGLAVVAATRIHPGAQPTEFDPQVSASGPYEVLLVELAPGIRATLQLVDGGTGPVEIGTRVDTRLRRLYGMEGHWRYGRKAVRRD